MLRLLALGLVLSSPCAAQPRVSRPVLAPVLPGAAGPALKLPAAPALSVSVLPALPAPTPLPVQASLKAVAETVVRAKPGSDKQAVAVASLFDGAKAVPAVAVPNGLTAPQGSGLSFPGELMGSQGAQAVPGSVFGWKPWKGAPSHGLPFVDRLVARAFGGESRRLAGAFELSGGGSPSVFLYGEKHSDKALIAENMARLASDMGPRGVVLVEGYLGPTLRGYEARRFLESRGMRVGALDGSEVEVRGWDRPESQDAATRLSLRHHMELLALNGLLWSERRGLSYYRELARQAWTTLQAYAAMRRAVLDARNLELDEDVAEAVRGEGTVHVIAGAEHLLERPLLARVPIVGRPRLRRGLEAAIGARAWRASKPAEAP